jgi:hypothetical protein
MALIFCASKSVGLVGFTWNTNPFSSYVQVSKMSLVYSFILHVLLILFVVIIPLKSYIDMHEKDASITYDTSFRAYSGVNDVIGFTVCFFNREEIFKITRIFAQQNRCSTRSEAVIVIELLLGMTLIVSSHYFHWIYVGSQLYSVPFFLFHTVTSFAAFAVHLQFIYFVFLLKQHFGEINVRLENLYLKVQSRYYIFYIPSSDLVGILHSCRVNHNSMCGTAVSVNSIYSPFLLFNIGLSFFRCVHNLYRMVSASISVNNVTIYSHPLMYLSYHWMKLLSLTYNCSSTATEVSSI